VPIPCLIMLNTDPIASLYERARNNGVPMSAICDRAGVAQTTPSRWKNGRNGATVEAVSKLESALSEILSERTGKAA